MSCRDLPLVYCQRTSWGSVEVRYDGDPLPYPFAMPWIAIIRTQGSAELQSFATARDAYRYAKAIASRSTDPRD